MSKEAALAFLKRAAEDAELQEKLVAFAADEGYEFTVDELSDTDLDKVVGGYTDLGGKTLHKFDSPEG